MKPDFTLVRDALPLDRLNCARIRQWLADDADLGGWSRSHPGAIRPHRLATLIQYQIWEAHDVTLAAVRQRLNLGRQVDPPRQIDYWVKIKIEKQPDEEVEVQTRTRFSLTSNERICAEIYITGGADDRAITDGAVPLRRRADS